MDWQQMTKDRIPEGKEWMEADFRDFQSWKRLQAKVNCMNALMVYRLDLERLEKLGLLKRR